MYDPADPAPLLRLARRIAGPLGTPDALDPSRVALLRAGVQLVLGLEVGPGMQLPLRDSRWVVAASVDLRRAYPVLALGQLTRGDRATLRTLHVERLRGATESEEAVDSSLVSLALALLEADVNFQVVKDFVAGVKAAALGDDILKGLNAGQQVVKLVHDKLTELMGTGDSQLAFGRPPTVILMTGVNGAGKTTTIGKLAQKFQNEGKSVMLAAGDTFRAAAIEQLQIWGKRMIGLAIEHFCGVMNNNGELLFAQGMAGESHQRPSLLWLRAMAAQPPLLPFIETF